jgi:hypothetical protein
MTNQPEMPAAEAELSEIRLSADKKQLSLTFEDGRHL